MKQRLLTPGPTPVPEETLLEMAKPGERWRNISNAIGLNVVSVALKGGHGPFAASVGSGAL